MIDPTIPAFSKSDFYAALRPGDLIFCWGNYRISEAIESFTGGPSHVLMAWLPGRWATQWLTLESTIHRGVHVGLLEEYVDGYDGTLMICRRQLTDNQIFSSLNAGLALIGEKYDTIEFASIVARKFCNRLPLIQPAKELYCSGLQQAIAIAGVPFNVPDKPWATPGQLYTDTSVHKIGRSGWLNT